MIEAMGLVGWEFNLANLVAVPIIIGTGVDNGVNMVYRWREERDKAQLILDKSVGKSVTISSLTTIAGFAALIPATHRGISSLGWTLSLGVTMILIATLLVLPALFELIGRRINLEHATKVEPETDPTPALKSAAARRSGMLAIVIAIGAALALASSSYASSSDRAASDAVAADAETLIRQAGEATPTDIKKIHAAMDKLHEALSIDPRNDTAYVDLGFCYGVLRDGTTATDMDMQATPLNPPAN